MSTDYTFYTIFGVKFKLDQFQEKVIVNSCEHPARIGQNFCPECGRRVYSETKTNQSYEYDGFVTAMDGLPAGWHFISKSDYSKGYAYLGFGIVADRYRDFEQSIDLDDIDIGDIKQEIKRILSEHGVWSDEIEKTFRLYSIMDIR